MKFPGARGWRRGQNIQSVWNQPSSPQGFPTAGQSCPVSPGTSPPAQPVLRWPRHVGTVVRSPRVDRLGGLPEAAHSRRQSGDLKKAWTSAFLVSEPPPLGRTPCLQALMTCSRWTVRAHNIPPCVYLYSDPAMFIVGFYICSTSEGQILRERTSLLGKQ